jgi:hypothetical protein
MKVLGFKAGTAKSISATGSSVSSAITIETSYDALHVANTSATLYVSIALGKGSAPTAVLGTYLTIPPMGQVLVSANSLVTHVAAIGSAAGPTAVVFTPVTTGA